MTSIFVIGMAAAFLLGNLPDAWQARMGLGIVADGAAIIDATTTTCPRTPTSPTSP